MDTEAEVSKQSPENADSCNNQALVKTRLLCSSSRGSGLINLSLMINRFGNHCTGGQICKMQGLGVYCEALSTDIKT